MVEGLGSEYIVYMRCHVSSSFKLCVVTFVFVVSLLSIMAFHLSRCVVCSQTTHCFSTWYVKVRLLGTATTWAMDVCSDCNEPLPGSTEESIAAEDALVSELKAMAMARMAEFPELFFWSRPEDASTEEPSSAISDFGEDSD